MRLSLLFLLSIIFIPTLVSSQNEVSNPEKVKIPKEIGVNFGRYIRGEYGFNGFFKIRRKQLEPTRKGRETQKNYRFSGGYFIKKPKDDPRVSIFGDERYDSTYNQKETHSYFMFGLEQSFKKKRYSYWYGLQIGPYKNIVYDDNFTRDTRIIAGVPSNLEYTTKTNGNYIGAVLDLNLGYKYALTSKLNLGLELNMWFLTTIYRSYSTDTRGRSYDSQHTDMNAFFTLFPRSLFISYSF
jgi:Protein of unknown function (DUF3575)